MRVQGRNNGYATFYEDITSYVNANYRLSARMDVTGFSNGNMTLHIEGTCLNDIPAGDLLIADLSNTQFWQKLEMINNLPLVGFVRLYPNVAAPNGAIITIYLTYDGKLSISSYIDSNSTPIPAGAYMVGELYATHR